MQRIPELRNEIEKLKLLNRISNADTLWAPTDSADVDYVYKTAEMINSSFNKTKNYIVIDKGATEGIQPEMAVCSSEGVVGIIEKVSNRYARVLPFDQYQSSDLSENQKTVTTVHFNGTETIIGILI